MHLKVTPNVGVRYWTAILIASMCGTNLGDILQDVLKIGTGSGLVMLALMFALLMAAERIATRASEAYYWLAILLVRAAATNIADFSIGRLHLRYLEAIAALALTFSAVLLLQHRRRQKLTKHALPTTDAFYWLTMLIAGSLGTVAGDATGHAFGAVQVGVPISTAIATVVLALILTARTRVVGLSATSYWFAVVAVRWWGTNVGDMSAHFLSLIPSAALTLSALTILLLTWRAPAAGAMAPARSYRA
jgi:uncharacterized membrane-anchored protein